MKDTIVNEIQILSPEQEAVKNVVIAKMDSLEQIRFQRKAEKEKLESRLLQDEEYKKLISEKKQMQLKVKLIKEKLSQAPEVFEMKENIKELNKDYNETKQDISDYLVTFEQQTGQLSFINPTTTQKVEIIRMAKPKIVKVQKK